MQGIESESQEGKPDFKKIHLVCVMVDLFFHLAGLRDDQITGRTFFLGVSVRVTPENISI